LNRKNAKRSQFSRVPTQAIEPGTWKTIAIGLGLALLLTSIPFLNFIFSYFLIIVHELGHALTAWIFGYPAIPAFDFMFGGGVTSIGDRVWGLTLFLYCGIGFFFFLARHNSFALKLLVGATAIYTLFSFSPLHQNLQIFMGHGCELIFAGIFLYRGLSGFACQRFGDRALYTMLAFFAIFDNFKFANALIFSEAARALYEQGKGGIIDNDFVLLAERLSMDLSGVAAFFGFCCLATPAIAFWCYRDRHRWEAILLKIRAPKH